MMVHAVRLVRIELVVAELARAERFYVEALGFARLGTMDADAPAVRGILLQRGGQMLGLLERHPQGAPYPPDMGANTSIFQHFAMPVPSIQPAVARLAAWAPAPISVGGPQLLPARSGGVWAYKFRDPDGHPLELIEFADRHNEGIDHSAIVVADVERSLAFYQARLAMRVASRQVNRGPEQNALDGLADAVVDVVGLATTVPTPHLELLGYRPPCAPPAQSVDDGDIAATRLVLECTGLEGRPLSLRDPDGHRLLLVPE